MGVEDPALQEWAERIGKARRRVLELSPEDQRRGAQLCGRYHTLADACKVLRGDAALSERRRVELLEELEELRDEFQVEFRAFGEAKGIPEL